MKVTVEIHYEIPGSDQDLVVGHPLSFAFPSTADGMRDHARMVLDALDENNLLLGDTPMNRGD